MLRSTILALAFLAFMTRGHSQTLTLSSEYGIPVSQSTTEINETGFLAFFDSNLGTLTAVTLELYGAGTTELSIVSSAAGTVNARVTGSSTLIFTSGYAPLNDFFQSNDPTIVLQFPVGIQTYVPGVTRSFGPISSSASNSFDLASLISQMQVPGGGNFSINAQSLNGLTVAGGGGNISSSQSTTAGSGARIIYSYTAIPEPSSAFLIAFASLLPLSRRRRA
jgi:hypothetical protein